MLMYTVTYFYLMQLTRVSVERRIKHVSSQKTALNNLKYILVLSRNFVYKGADFGQTLWGGREHTQILREFLNQENILIPVNSPLTVQKPTSRKQTGALAKTNPVLCKLMLEHRKLSNVLRLVTSPHFMFNQHFFKTGFPECSK